MMVRQNQFILFLIKLDECLTINRAYKYYDGNLVDVSAITEVNVK